MVAVESLKILVLHVNVTERLVKKRQIIVVQFLRQAKPGIFRIRLKRT